MIMAIPCDIRRRTRKEGGNLEYATRIEWCMPIKSPGVPALSRSCSLLTLLAGTSHLVNTPSSVTTCMRPVLFGAHFSIHLTTWTSGASAATIES